MAKELLTTPKGTTSYPWLNKADEKFPPAKYKTDLIVEVGEAGELTDKLEAILDDHFQEVSKREADSNYEEIRKSDLPFYEEDGNIIFRTTVNKEGKNKKTGETWENKVGFFDAAGKFMPEGKRPKIGNGSIIKVSFEPNLYAMADAEGKGKAKKTYLNVGVAMRLKAIQVLSVADNAAQQSAASVGFGVEEGGFEYNPDDFDGTETITDAGDF